MQQLQGPANRLRDDDDPRTDDEALEAYGTPAPSAPSAPVEASGPNDGDVVEQGKNWGKGKNKGKGDDVNEPGKGKDKGKGNTKGHDDDINEGDEHVWANMILWHRQRGCSDSHHFTFTSLRKMPFTDINFSTCC